LICPQGQGEEVITALNKGAITDADRDLNQ
jgi:hypothetical protein